jgi:hypothetical protein
MVFLELFRRGGEIYHWGDYSGREVDFVVKELKVKQLIQVCWDLNEKTRAREVKALLKAMEKFKLKEGLIITEDFEGEEEIKGNRITYRPLWKWLL